MKHQSMTITDNNRRYDLSNKLTHFFRKLDQTDGSTPHTPEDWGSANITEDTVFSPLFLLRSAIRHGWMWSTWSLRGGARTVYGPYPAVCFTEMPTAAFLETSVARLKKKQKISSYALTFPKDQMFDLGARPVIYGLSGNPKIPSGKGGGPRFLSDCALPEGEQYRFVTYAPTGGRWSIDWTHEREWRWCLTDKDAIAKFEAEIEEMGIVDYVKDIPGLDLYSGTIKGIGVIVNTKEEAGMVIHDVLSLVDQDRISPDTYEYVLVADEIASPGLLRDPDDEANAIAAATIDLSSLLTHRDDSVLNQIIEMATQVVAKNPKVEVGEPGTCWLWLIDNTHLKTRALVNDGHITVSNGKYLLPIHDFSTLQSLGQREKMMEVLASRVQNTLGIEASYFSVLGSDNPEQVPFYNGDVLGNRLFYNYWSQNLD